MNARRLLRPLRRLLRPLRPWLPFQALIVAAVAGIMMAEASGLLKRLHLAGAPSYGAGALTGWPGLPWEHRAITEAITAWSDRTDDTILREPALAWLYWHLGLDAVLFIPAYAVLLVVAFQAVGYDGRTTWLLVVPVVLMDAIETLWTLLILVVGRLEGPPNGTAATVLAVLSMLKWLAAGLAVAAVLLRWLARDTGPPRPGAGDRVWRRHRVQIVAVAVLFLTFVAPLGGPLDQVPDIVRAWVHPGREPGEDAGFPAAQVFGPLAGTLLLCVALWVAGRWALLDGAAPKRRPARWVPSMAAGAAVCGLFVVLRFVIRLDVGLNLLGVALVLFVVGGTSGLIARFSPQVWSSASAADAETDVPGHRWERVRFIGRCLCVAPLVAFGLLLVRAFGGPVLLPESVEISVGGVWAWLIVGAVLAVIVAPLCAWGVARWEGPRSEGQRGAVAGLCAWGVSERQGARMNGYDRAGAAPHVAGIGVLVIGAAVAVAGAVGPRTTGEGLRVIGLITTMMATLVIGFGWAQRKAEMRLPAPLFSRLHRTPFLLLSVTALLVAAQFDAGRYHTVSVARGAPPAANPMNSLDAAFDLWLDAVRRRCTPDLERPAIPLVLVAAPGGGARAAYWSAAALDDLTNPELQVAALRRADAAAAGQACGDTAVFAISGVSGGSLGAAAWAVAKYGAPAPELATGAKSAAAVVTEGPLAALLSAGLFRDFPRILHGIDGTDEEHITDRARVFEEAWEYANPGLGKDMMAVAPVAGSWRPLLLFNGTAVETGCRVVVAPIPASVTAEERDGRLASCRAVAGPAGGGESGRFAVGAVDARDYLAGRARDDERCTVPADATLRLSTAALLSARFPYVTPTGILVFCAGADTLSRTFDVDGGYLENNGIALALDLWRALEPTVAQHNREATGDQPLVAPMLVVLDNHYQSTDAAAAADRPAELVAPLSAYLAPMAAHTDSIMLQDALLELSGPLPGREDGHLLVGDDVCSSSRVFRVAPYEHPGVEAPLGWVLSAAAQADLRTELRKQVASGSPCNTNPDLVAGTMPALEAGEMATVLQMLGGALNVR